MREDKGNNRGKGKMVEEKHRVRDGEERSAKESAEKEKTRREREGRRR